MAANPTPTLLRNNAMESLTQTEKTLRSAALVRVDPADIPAMIDSELRHRALLLADLADPDLSGDETTALRNGVALADYHLQEYADLAARHARAATVPGYGAVQPSDDLGPRFAAARWVDLVGLAETLTAQTAVKTGRRFRIRCPFHDDITPSLVIYEPGRGWHCFVCGVGGSPIDLVMRLQHLNAVEALLVVETLAVTCPAAWKAS
jgi:hypothetical protein